MADADVEADATRAEEPLSAQESSEEASTAREERHPTIQTTDSAGAPAGAGDKEEDKELSRRKEKEKEKRRSFSKASAISHSASAVEWESEEREATHLRDQNQKLKQQVKSMKQTIRSLKEGQARPMNSQDEKTAEELRMQNEEYEADIVKWKERAAAVNDIGLLDGLLDEVAQKKLEIKALELQRRQLTDARRDNSKLLHHSEDQPSRQKVFLDLKDERRRQLKKVDEAQGRKEKLSEQIEWIKKRAEEAMAEVEALGLQKYEVASVRNLQKQDEEQTRTLEKLEAQIAVANSSFDAMRTRTTWATQDQQVILNELRAEIEKVQSQIQQKEALIMSNGGMTEKPPHFVAPLDAQPPKGPKQGTSPKSSPRAKQSAPPKKKEVEKGEEKQHVPKPPPKSKAAPAPAPKNAKTEQPAKKPAPPPKKSEQKQQQEAAAPQASGESTSAAEEDAPKKVQSDSNDRLNDLEDDRYSDDHEPAENGAGAPQSASRPQSKSSRSQVSSRSSRSRSRSRSDRRSSHSSPSPDQQSGKRSATPPRSDGATAAKAGGAEEPEYEDDCDPAEEAPKVGSESEARPSASGDRAKRDDTVDEEVKDEEVKEEVTPAFLTE